MTLPPAPLRAVVLDTGPLSLAASPKRTPERDACSLWIEALTDAGVQVIVPEIADYELRRELVRAGKTQSLAALEALTAALTYLPLDTPTMRRAAALWAQARQANRQTADPHALDADVILCAQAQALGYPPSELVVATTNPAHLSLFLPARRWPEIPAGGL